MGMLKSLKATPVSAALTSRTADHRSISCSSIDFFEPVRSFATCDYGTLPKLVEPPEAASRVNGSPWGPLSAQGVEHERSGLLRSDLTASWSLGAVRWARRVARACE